MAKHPEKRYVVIAVGATPMPCDLWPASEHEEAFRRSFPADSYPDLPWVYCRGGFHFERLGVMDKIAMRIYFKMLEDEIARQIIGDNQFFLAINAPWQANAIPCYFLCGIFCALVGVYVIKAAYFTSAQLKSRFRNPWLRLFAGGSVLCLIRRRGRGTT